LAFEPNSERKTLSNNRELMQTHSISQQYQVACCWCD